jgi:hypothetical protein
MATGEYGPLAAWKRCPMLERAVVNGTADRQHADLQLRGSPSRDAGIEPRLWRDSSHQPDAVDMPADPTPGTSDRPPEA